MSVLTLRFDNNTDHTIRNLMEYWGYKDEAELFTQTLNHFILMTEVASTNGELIARKGLDETKILLR